MPVLFSNNATSLLPNPVDTSQTNIAVSPGDGSKFPSPSGNDWFPVTMLKADGTLEICRCTARGGDVLTVIREQENTVASDFEVGDRISLRVTAAAIQEQFTLAERSKLAEIEDKATQDMTALEIREALKTVDGSGSGIDSDLLVGRTGASYLNTAGGSWGGSHTFTGSFSVTGTTTTGALTTGALTTNGDATINGSLTATGNVTAFSDETLKSNIVEIGRPLDRLRQIRGVTYDRIDIEQHGAGVIAQDVATAFPTAVQHNGDILSVDMMALIGLLIGAVNELRDKVESNA